MPYIKSIQYNRRQVERRLTCSLLAATTLSAPALSSQLPAELPAVTVHGQAEDDLKTERSGSAKIGQPLLDTTQTITVIPKALLQQENVHSLRGALSNVSGITFNAGEGGGGSGDNINVRGFNATNSLQLDGLRDSALNNRSDLFNVESVEVIKGPNAVFGGSGATGGNVNMISKQPRRDDFLRAETGLGTDHYRRLAVDANGQQSTAGLAWRLNFMAHANDVPGRRRIDRNRWGVAPSVRFGENGPTQWTLNYLHQNDRNLPDYGVPAIDGKAFPGVPREAYFGWRNVDQEKIKANIFTSLIEHRFNAARAQNITRYSVLDRDTTVSASHIYTLDMPPGRYFPAGPQGFRQDFSTSMLANQSILNFNVDTWGLVHQLSSGLEFSKEKLHRQAYRLPLYGNFPEEGYLLKSPPEYWPGPKTAVPGTRTETRLDTVAVFLMDNLRLSEHWELGAGLRQDWLKGQARYRQPDGSRSAFHTRDKHLSGRGSLSWRPTANGRVYIAYGNSFNPAAEWLISSTNGLNDNTKDIAPERSSNWELGSKWEVLNQRLALTAAIFQMTKHNEREFNPDRTVSLTGKRRVRGLEFGAAGKLHAGWSIYANYTYMDARTLKLDTAPQQVGRRMANSPAHSANLWTSYEWSSGFRAGYGLHYVGKRPVHSALAAQLPSHLVQRMMLGYSVNSRLELQLNIDNLTDKVYVERARLVGGWEGRSSALEYGDGRSAILTANWRF